jgi:hypothetical protein
VRVIVTVSETGDEPPAAGSRYLSSLRERALMTGVPIQVEPIPGGTKVDWAIPVSAR